MRSQRRRCSKPWMRSWRRARAVQRLFSSLIGERRTADAASDALLLYGRGQRINHGCETEKFENGPAFLHVIHMVQFLLGALGL